MSHLLPSRPAWDYLRLFLPFTDLAPERSLNELGQEGWELVAVYEGQEPPLVGNGRSADGRIFLLKRPK